MKWQTRENQRDVGATDAETAEADMATAEEVLEPVPEDIVPDAPVLSQDPLF